MTNVNGTDSGDEHQGEWSDAQAAAHEASSLGIKPLGSAEYDETAHAARLSLGDEERLPWLESADDVDYDESASNSGRVFLLMALAILFLAAVVGAIYWLSHRSSAETAADGSLIEASKEPYKIAPQDPGGKTFQGTGDSSFKVSEGEKPGANLAGGAASSAPKPSAAAANAPGSAAAGGVGVQVGAFGSSASAEAAWIKLVGQHEALKGMAHRAIEGKADIGTVYRLQAIAADLGAATSLCNKLQSEGVKCQVKR